MDWKQAFFIFIVGMTVFSAEQLNHAIQAQDALSHLRATAVPAIEKAIEADTLFDAKCEIKSTMFTELIRYSTYRAIASCHTSFALYHGTVDLTRFDDENMFWQLTRVQESKRVEK